MVQNSSELKGVIMNSNKEKITIVMEKLLANRLRDSAKKNCRSLSSEGLYAIKQYLEAKESHYEMEHKEN